MSYWKDRAAKSMDKLTGKTQRAIEMRLRKYYRDAATRAIEDFEATYNKLLATVAEGRQPTPADLYKLDKYWQAQAQLREELRKLGEKQVVELTKQFERNWFDIYYSINLGDTTPYATIDSATVQQMLEAIWCADGKSWSKRIWENTNRLMETLNDGLIHCVTTGKKPSELKKVLQNRFNVSYSRADALVRTELAHIQTQAAEQRYKDYGIEFVEIWADEDERRCEVCGKLHQKKYKVGDPLPIPAHTNCRCCIVPVVE